MKLKIGNLHVKDVLFGEQDRFENGVLTFDKEAALNYLRDLYPNITSLDVVIAHPGDDTRIVPVVEAIEPRCRMDGRTLFPGYLDAVVPAGEGELKALKDCCVTIVSKEKACYSDGVIDMGGEGAKHSYFSKLINICLVGASNEEVEGHPTHRPYVSLRQAGHQFAEYLGKIAYDVEPEDVDEFNFEPVLKRSAEHSMLPNVALILQPCSQMEIPGYNDFLYGWDMNRYLPSFISPTEILDGAIISASFMPASSKWSTYEMQNFATIKELFAEDGKTINFVGVIMSNLQVVLEQKERSAVMVRNIALNLGVEYAIVVEEAYGNPDVDYARCQVILEDAGIRVVGIANESAGRDGFTQPLVTLDEKMDALVSTGNVNELIELPACKTVIGYLEAMNLDGMSGCWGYDEILGKSARDDGSVIMEDNSWFGGDAVCGLSIKSVKEY